MFTSSRHTLRFQNSKNLATSLFSKLVSSRKVLIWELITTETLALIEYEPNSLSCDSMEIWQKMKYLDVEDSQTLFSNWQDCLILNHNMQNIVLNAPGLSLAWLGQGTKRKMTF